MSKTPHTEKPAEKQEERPIMPGIPQPIVQPMIEELKDQQRPKTIEPSADAEAPPRGPVHPPQPAELDQDPGGEFNTSHVYPQT